MNQPGIILDQFGRVATRDITPSVRDVHAKYDLAQTTAHNRRHWSFADGLSARASMSPAIRKLCRERSRYEWANNSWYSGIVSTAANHIVGKGPRLQILTADPVANTRIERAFVKWARGINLPAKLRLMVQTYWRDGEVFAMRTSRPRNWPISLDVRIYEPEQCAAPWAGNILGDPFSDDGVRVDQSSNEVEYFFYDHHPGANVFAPTMAGEWYPAMDVVHLFRQDRPDQVRGIPRATPALSTLPVMRRQEMATLLASETAASFATFLKSTNPQIQPAQFSSDFNDFEIAFNMLTQLPPGWEIAQVDPKHPGANHSQFQMQCLMSFSRCTNMPLALAMGTSKDSNFSSLKGDMKNVWEPEVQTEQNLIELTVIEKFFGWFLEDAVYVPGLLEGLPSITEIDHQWYWPPLPNLDEVDAATASKIRLSIGQSGPSREMARVGNDYETEVAQMAKDYGIPVEQMKARILEVNLPQAVPASPGFGGSAGTAAAAPGGAYTELGQRAWNNNQTRIRRILDAFISGASEGRTRLDLQSIGLDADTVQGYIDDSRDGQIASPELQPIGVPS